MQKRSKTRSAKVDLSEVPELGKEFFGRAVQGKYLARVQAAGKLVRIDSELSKDFPDEATVNEALRLVKQIREIGRKKDKKRIA